ncbi:MAG TPA: hypothetical protein DDW94_07040 [Deltaproteobacteria bacterium]|nr:hypothetical protein [Deltaproteobacteria bacterium]HCY11262.1 hypothetical protein [Deltaproteobacteria bacterium]
MAASVLKPVFQRHTRIMGLLLKINERVLALPTICLFSSTKPANSDAPVSERYLYLEKGVSCRPCGAMEQCPKNQKNYCENFVEPESVSEEIMRMLSNVYGTNI